MFEVEKILVIFTYISLTCFQNILPLTSILTYHFIMGICKCSLCYTY